jgi:tripartite-type tricarboxylate transporter receptor subunit TctC
MRSKMGALGRVLYPSLAGILLAAMMVASAASADYPDRPINVILPWPPAAATDVSARLILDIMSEELGVPLQVINRPGGRGVIGTNELVQATPDGYTIGAITVGPAVSQVASGNTPYDMDALEPIGLYTTLPFVLLARADAPYDSLADLREYTAARDEPWVLGHWGRAAVPTLTLYRIAQADGYEFREIAFEDLSASQLLNRDADLVTVSTPAVMGQIEEGSVKPIAAMTPVRNVALPELPTVSEQGYDFDAAIWAGLFAPAGTPEAVIQRLTQALENALEDPRVDAYVEASGAVMFYRGPEETRHQMEAEHDAYREIMVHLGLVE